MPLRIDLLRHGQARAADETGDAARPLTSAGALAIVSLGERLKARGWHPDRVLVSPLARARETALIVTSAAGSDVSHEIRSELEPERRPDAVAATLSAELEGVAHALLVGHQPLLGSLVALWGGPSDGLSPGEMVTIEFEDVPRPGRGRVVGRLTGG